MGCIFREICPYYEVSGSCESTAKIASKCLKSQDSSRPTFYGNNVQGNFIKGLINNYPIPNYDTIRLGDYAVKGVKYFFIDKVINITKEGILGETCEYDVVRNQRFGVHFVKLSEVFNSNSQVYDSNTHERLGDLLRCFRDVYGVNLMSMYNCYSSRQTSDFYIDKSRGVLETKNKLYKVYQVPIKFNKTYTIAIDCTSNISIAPAFIMNNRLINIQREGSFPSNISKTLFTESNTLFDIGSDFTKPHLMTVTAKESGFEKEFMQYEKWLYLLIQVPLSCDSSLVVLEGDYTHPSKLVEVASGVLPTAVEYYDPLTYFDTHTQVTFEDQTQFAKENRRYVQYCDVQDLMMCIHTHTIQAGDTVKWHPEYFQKVSNVKAIQVNKCIDKTFLYGLNDMELDELLYGKLFLLQMNDKTQHPYSINLISYLLRNVITSSEEITENIRKTEKSLVNSPYKVRVVDTGIWDISLRDALFSAATENVSAGNLDILGYVDKKLEAYLRGLDSSVIW